MEVPGVDAPAGTNSDVQFALTGDSGGQEDADSSEESEVAEVQNIPVGGAGAEQQQ